MPLGPANLSVEKEQLASIVRRLMIDADDFFVQQQKTLQLSYAELNSRIEQLRMRVQQQQQQQQRSSGNGVYNNMNPSPFSTVHSVTNADMVGLSGSSHGVLSSNSIGQKNINATPLRPTSTASNNNNNNTLGSATGGGAGAAGSNGGTFRSLMSSLNGPSAMLAMSEAAPESARPNSTTTSGAGYLGSASANGAGLTGGVRNYRGEVITPPNNQLALSRGTSKSPSMPQHMQAPLPPPPMSGLMGTGSSVLDDPITGEYFSTAPNTIATNAGASHHDSLMASPQATQKLSLEELIDRFNMNTTSVNAATAATAFNFDSLYEQLTSGGPEESSQSPLDYTDNSIDVQDRYPHAHVSSPSPYDRSHNGGAAEGVSLDTNALSSGAGGGGTAAGAKNSIPVDSLRAVHDQHLTTSVRATYDQGRPKVLKVSGGAPDTPESLGINPRGSCEVLVEFKRKRVLQYESNEYVAPGSYVIVGGDRGEDLGLVVYAWCEVAAASAALDGSRNSLSASEHNILGNGASSNGNSGHHGGKRKVVGVGLTDSKLPRSMGVGNGTVLRLATDVEVQQLLGTQAELERRAIDVCAQLVLDHSLPMVIVDAEYQFDKKKLTFFYEAQQRMDFRELVRHLYKTFRARIWMELVDA